MWRVKYCRPPVGGYARIHFSLPLISYVIIFSLHGLFIYKRQCDYFKNEAKAKVNKRPYDKVKWMS